MSNPRLTIGASISTPDDPSFTRKAYRMMTFSDAPPSMPYAEGEFNITGATGATAPTGGQFDPKNKGTNYRSEIPLQDALSGFKPDFISQGVWDTILKKTASTFITPQGTLMPQLMIPSKILVDNGLYTNYKKLAAFTDDTATKEAFNWELVQFISSSAGGATGTTTAIGPAGDVGAYARLGGYAGSTYVSVIGKKDSSQWSYMEFDLNDPPIMGGAAPTGSTSQGAWSGALVNDGAFALMLNIEPMVPGTTNWTYSQESPWELKIVFGEVKMWMSEVGSLNVQLTGDGADQTVHKLNLISSATSGGLPQSRHISGGSAFTILVYPVWNGIVVQSGLQNTEESVKSTSTYIPRKQDVSMLNAPYSTGFNLENPAEVEVGVSSGSTGVSVDFGDKIDLNMRNARGEFAFVPAFFSREGWLDNWMTEPIGVTGLSGATGATGGTGTIDYSYSVYPIWTKNTTNTTLDPAPAVNDSGDASSESGSNYQWVPWRLSQSFHNRQGAEIFGAVIKMEDTRTEAVRNDNGSFDLLWTGTGIPGDPYPIREGYVTDEDEANSNGLGNSAGSHNSKVAMSFQINESRTDINSVEMSLTKVGTPGVITARIETDNSDSPSGTLANGNLTTTIAEADVGDGFVRGAFSSNGSLTANTTYWIVLSLASDPGSGNVYKVNGDSTDFYDNGKYKYHPSLGSWSTSAQISDAAFRVTSEDAGNWRYYVQNVSVSVSIDGSSGQMVIDKYGTASQGATAVQDIGAITFGITGASGTVGGDIFKGVGYGIQDTQSSDGGTWTVPLFGLEKKLEDIVMVNYPFVDGELLSETFTLLAKYAGLVDDQSNSSVAGTTRMSISEDINVSRFEWNSGTTVKEALDAVMEDTLHWYVVRDGKIFLYELDAFGLPVSPGANRKGDYPDTKVISEDLTPDLDVLRNESIVSALAVNKDGQRELASIPIYPRVVAQAYDTVPDIPWSKAMHNSVTGFLTEEEVVDIAEKMKKETRLYKIMGRTTIAGNADIKPYDRWGTYIIYSVSHNIDLQSKSWTTDLEFATGAS